jgi:hypothetical protein
MSEGKIYLPHEDWGDEEKKKIEAYYQNKITWQEALKHLYGGLDLREIVSEIKIDIENELDRTVTFSLNTKEGWLSIGNLSFKQLLVESSYRYGNGANQPIEDWENDGWDKLSTQQRLEVCQNELSRWSVIIIDKKNVNWENGLPAELSMQGGEWIDYLEIVNNCTTNRGFELKIKTSAGAYHGSFCIPQTPYRKLCTVQSGAWAWQGWNVLYGEPEKIGDYYASLISIKEKPNTINNPTFGQVYDSDSNANENILIDLKEYRTLVSGSEKNYKIEINKGAICYNRWGENKEYETKPYDRKLVIDPDGSTYINPPRTYLEVLEPSNPSGDFKLPKFGEDGLYDVRVAIDKNKYPILSKLDTLIITKTSVGLYELQLKIKDPANDTSLCKIVLGNLSLDLGDDFFVIDRFCFNPRQTVSHYDHNWLPAAETFGATKKAVYAFVLGREVSTDDVSGNIFIQPENWGIERVILKREDNLLFIDLISYERIVPVWQGKIDLEVEVVNV